MGATERMCDLSEAKGGRGIRGRIAVSPGIVAAAPVEEDAIDRGVARCQSFDESGDKPPIVHRIRASDSQPVQHSRDELLLEPIAPAAQQV